MDSRHYTLSELADIDIDLWVNAMGELADRHGDEIDGFKDDRDNCPAEYEAEFVQFAEDRGIRFDEHGHILNAAVTMNANDHRITWCLNWGEDAISGWSACYCVSPDQERERREKGTEK